MLLFTAISEDQQRLDVEAEQAQVQEALMPLIAEGVVLLEMPDDGRFETLQRILNQYQPHLVFLSGHGKYHDQSALGKQSYASFLFETDGHDSHAVPGKELAQAFIGTSVQCVVLSACESGMSASDQLNTGLLHQLALLGLPHVIGMRESILDPAGTQFNRSFCAAIAQQQRVDIAIQQARSAITQPLNGTNKYLQQSAAIQELSFGQWCLPILISSDPQQALIDWNFERLAPKINNDNRSLSCLTLPAQFIGRRHELRSLERRLANHSLNRLLITGPGGQGKTALIGKLALKLQQQGASIPMAFS